MVFGCASIRDICNACDRRLVSTKINTEASGKALLSGLGSFVAELTTWRAEVRDSVLLRRVS